MCSWPFCAAMCRVLSQPWVVEVVEEEEEASREGSRSWGACVGGGLRLVDVGFRGGLEDRRRDRRFFCSRAGGGWRLSCLLLPPKKLLSAVEVAGEVCSVLGEVKAESWKNPDWNEDVSETETEELLALWRNPSMEGKGSQRLASSSPPLTLYETSIGSAIIPSNVSAGLVTELGKSAVAASIDEVVEIWL